MIVITINYHFVLSELCLGVFKSTNSSVMSNRTALLFIINHLLLLVMVWYRYNDDGNLLVN